MNLYLVLLFPDDVGFLDDHRVKVYESKKSNIVIK